MSDLLLYPVTHPSRVCEQLKTPIYMLAIGVSLLQQHFGNPDRIVLEKSRFLYSETTTDGDCSDELFIGYRDNLNYQAVGKRPSVIVELGECVYPPEVIGDLLSGSQINNGIEGILDRYTSSWKFNCLSGKPLEALALATEVKYFLQTYRRFISTTYKMDKLRVASLSPYQKFEEYKDNYGCQVTVPFSVQDNFGLKTESLKVSGICLNFN